MLGKKFKDKLTGVVGVVTARIEYLDGSPRSLLEYVDAAGHAHEKWVEDTRLEAVTD